MASDFDRVAIDDRGATIHRVGERFRPTRYRALKAGAVLHDELHREGGYRGHGHENEPHRHAGEAAPAIAPRTSVLTPLVRPIAKVTVDLAHAPLSPEGRMLPIGG